MENNKIVSLANLARYNDNIQAVIDSKIQKLITESGSNKRAQFGSSSSYTYGTCVIRMKFKLKYT